MDAKELVERYFVAWNQKNLSDLLRLMHPQASYYDAYWAESCSGKDLSKYFGAAFEMEPYRYEHEDDFILTPNGLISRYSAFDCSDAEGSEPLFNGAEVFTVSDNLILTVSDFYCDPNETDLIEIAALAEGQHGRANVVKGGLGTKTAGRIKNRLAQLSKDMTVLVDPSLTVTKLAEAAECSVMHLFAVLEEQKETTFLEFVNEGRARYASTLLIELSNDEKNLDRIAKQSGFKSVAELDKAFQATFGINVDEYLLKFAN